MYVRVYWDESALTDAIQSGNRKWALLQQRFYCPLAEAASRAARARTACRLPANIHVDNTTVHTDSDMSITINRTNICMLQYQ